MKTLKDYAAEELRIVEERLRNYTEYGYSPFLEPVVDALRKCQRELKSISVVSEDMIDWKAYREYLQLSISNERLWAMGCDSQGEPSNCHVENIERMEDELKAIGNLDYQEIIEAHDDDDYWTDFLK